MDFKTRFIEILNKTDIILSDRQVETFSNFYDDLIETNKHMNLTSITDMDEVIIKHFIDSLLLYDNRYFKNVKTFCDLGTGAGFPGIPINIYLDNIRVFLLDSLKKRLGFLNKFIKNNNLNCIETHHIRAEDAGHDIIHREKYDFVSARAVARLNVLAEYCLPLVKKGGYFAAMKGDVSPQEILEAKNVISLLGGAIVELKKVELPILTDKRTIIFIKKIKNTPIKYPRKAGLPSKEPLI